jgi:hypothetical protein
MGANQMTIVSQTVIHPKPGASWDALQKQIKKGNDLATKYGGENVVTMVGMASGPETGTLSVAVTCPDWTSFGKFQEALMADSEMQGLMADPNSPVASWDTYVSMTLDL